MSDLSIAGQIAELHSGDTPEEILAARIAALATITPAGTRMPGAETDYPPERGRLQIKDDRVCCGEFYEPIHVGGEDVHEVRMAYKAALVEAARSLVAGGEEDPVAVEAPLSLSPYDPLPFSARTWPG